MTDAPRPPIVVIGGGIAGLAAAWQLHRDGVDFVLVEAADRVGGKIVTTPFANALVDQAADAFLARVPHGTELAKELGIADRLISPTARRAQVYRPGTGLVPLPEPHVLGIPLDRDVAEQMLGADAAAALDADLARTEPDPIRPGETIGSLVRRRVGDEIHEALVDPLIGAINAGDTDLLDLVASSPQIAAAAEASPSLIAALAAQRAKRSSDAPVFHAFESGMATLVDALATQLGDRIRTGLAVQAVAPRLDRSLVVDLADGTSLHASAVICATPAPAAAEILSGWPHAAGVLGAIPMVSVTLVALAYPAATVNEADGMSGFVVPRTAADVTITACSYASTKWAHLGDEGRPDLLRVSVGHRGDQTTPALPDDELLAVVRADLKTTLDIDVAPLATRISRWPAAFPQYLAGHPDALLTAEGDLNPDGVFLAGMGYRGIGIPANIDQGRNAAVEALLFTI